MAKADFREITDVLRAETAAGEYPPGSRFPTGPEIADRFKVSKATANLAVGELRSEGLVRTKRGRGTIVNPVPILRREVSGHPGNPGDAIRAAGFEPRSEVRQGRAVPPAGVATALGIAGDDLAAFRASVTYAGEYPVRADTMWLPPDAPAGEDADGPDSSQVSLDGLTGHDAARYAQTIRDRVPTSSEADALDLDPDQHVLDLIRTATDDAGSVVEVGQVILPAHQWELVFSWPAGD